MKNPNTPTPKLLSKRQFARRRAALQEKHRWFLKDKPLDIRPGWLHILDTTLLKIQSILTPQDIEQSRLEFLYSSTQGELRVFVDGEKLSPARFNVVDHMLEEATKASELSCFKCGCEIAKNGYQRYTGLCDETYVIRPPVAQYHLNSISSLSKSGISKCMDSCLGSTTSNYLPTHDWEVRLALLLSGHGRPYARLPHTA